MKAAVAVMIAVAVTPAAMRKSKHALDGAHGAADASPDCAAHDTADRACDPVAFIGAFLRAAHDALGVTGMGNGQ